MATSQNGWTVLEERPPLVLVPYIDYEVGFHLRPGPVAVVLLEVARRWHEEVEPLDLPGPRDEWGWAYRPIRGEDEGYSNHASGTATDLNATRHPRGVPTKDTMTDAQIARCRAIVQSMMDRETERPVVRWGGDYKSTPDAMHWEIVGGAEAVRRVADRVGAKWREIEDNMATPDEIAAEVAPATVKLLLATPIKELPYVKALLRDADGNSTIVELLNHSVGQSVGALNNTIEIKRQLDDVTRQLALLTAAVAAKEEGP